jgi:hypothetical protein
LNPVALIGEIGLAIGAVADYQSILSRFREAYAERFASGRVNQFERRRDAEPIDALNFVAEAIPEILIRRDAVSAAGARQWLH